MSQRELPLEALSVRSMANGWSCLVLTELISWEQFPDYVSTMSQVLGAQERETIELAEARICDVVVDGHAFAVVWEDYPIGVSLEPRSDQASARISRLAQVLEEWRDSRSG